MLSHRPTVRHPGSAAWSILGDVLIRENFREYLDHLLHDGYSVRHDAHGSDPDVTEPSQAKKILQMVPRQAAKRTPHYVAQYNDAQSACWSFSLHDVLHLMHKDIRPGQPGILFSCISFARNPGDAGS